MKRRWFLILTAILSTLCGLCPSKAAAPDPGRGWQVIVLEEVSPAIKALPVKWASVLSDGKTVKRLDAFVVSAGDHLWSLAIQPVSGHCTCKDSKFPFSYQVDQLVATALSQPKQTKVLSGDTAVESARAVMRDHQASCDGIKALPFAPDTTESYERSKTRLLSNFNGQVGLEVVSESFAYGRPAAMVSADWAAYRLDKDPIAKVSKKSLPAGAMAEASSRFAKLPEKERDPFSPADFGHFVLAPSGGSAAVEFGVPGTGDAVRNQVRVVRVEMAGGLGNDDDKMRLAFRHQHPKLIPFDQVSFYTVNPDQSAVVFAENGSLYWQGLSGKPRLIGQVKQVRGWQWHHGAW